MLSVAIHKDIAEYQPKVIGKLTGRTLISITVALGLSIAVAVYMNLVLKIDPTDHLEFIYAVSLPCWCCGFWKPHGLPFEQFALLWLQHQLSDNRLFYKPSMFKSGFVKTPDEITQSRNRQWHLAHRIHLLLAGDTEALAIKLDHRVLKDTGTNDANEFLFCRFRQTAGIHLEHSVISIRIRFRCDRSWYGTETKLFHLFLHHFIDKEIGKRLRAVPTINFCRTI